MQNTTITAFLQKHAIFDLSQEKQVLSVIRILSQIPWGEARTVEDVLDRNVGTCTGKHKVLQNALDILAVKYRPVVCTFLWSNQGIRFPQHIQNILSEGEWEHGHNFIQLQKNEYFIDVDITWDSGLAEWGFKTFPEFWNGQDSFVGLKTMEKRWDGVEIDSLKNQLVENLTVPQQERRRRFLHDLFAWVSSLRR